MLSKNFTALAGLGLAVSRALAGFEAGPSNIAVYWGQNSVNQKDSQQRLSTYCSNADIDVIPLAFMNVIVNPTTINFANAGDNCTTFEGSTLLKCPQLEEDIKSCQADHGKTILLSIGGATYTEGGFASADDATKAADNVWALFGPDQGGGGNGSSSAAVNRPFGSAVVDGFDFDFESTTQNMVPFGQRLRSNMDADTSKKYFLSAAPQCVYPDAADGEMLDGKVAFDFIMVQFYNNYCGANNFAPGSDNQSAYNFDVWDGWAKNGSANKDVRVLLGLPAATGAGGGYVDGTQLSGVIEYSKKFASFGGVMLWDMSQLYQNNGFLDAVKTALGK